MSVWLCLPSKRPPEEARACLQKWADQGYNIALFCDDFQDMMAKEPKWPVPQTSMAISARFHGITGNYPGYAQAVNALVLMILRDDPKCDWVVVAGDDMEPDANYSAEEIAQQCSDHFKALAHGYGPADPTKRGVPPNNYMWGCWSNDESICDRIASTFGVMQPSGDRYGESPSSIATYGADRAAYADRVCGSPWIGREFALRINQGKGPLWPEYMHMFEDEELFEVANKLGVLWMRRDLIHLHNHWARKRSDVADRPKWLEEASGPEHWKKYGAIFRARKAAGFPGSDPL